MRNENTKLRSENDSLRNENGNLRTQLKEKDGVIREANNSIATAEGDTAAVTESCVVLNATLQERDAAVEELRTQYEDLHTRFEDDPRYEDLRTRYEEQQTVVKARDIEIKNLKEVIQKKDDDARFKTPAGTATSAIRWRCPRHQQRVVPGRCRAVKIGHSGLVTHEVDAYGNRAACILPTHALRSTRPHTSRQMALLDAHDAVCIVTQAALLSPI